MQLDSDFLNPDETNDTDGPSVVISPPVPDPSELATYQSLLDVSPAVQNSFIPRFLPGILPSLTGTLDTDNSTPTLPDDGRFEVYFAFQENGMELARVQFSVFKGSYTSSLTAQDLTEQLCAFPQE